MTMKGRFERFTTRIRPTDEHIKEANRQVEFMIGRLHDKVSDDGTFTLEKILRAGSNAKFTSLLRTEHNLFDVDLGAYFSGAGATKAQLNELLQFTRDRLVEIYPQKDKDKDFEVLKSAVRVKFTSGIKLWVDVAPIVKDDSLGITNGGHIPRNDGWRLTSVTAHNEIRRQANRRQQKSVWTGALQPPGADGQMVEQPAGTLVQPSIFCELIAAAAVASTGVTSEWQTSLRQVFTFLRKHQFNEPIVFNDYYDPNKAKLATGTVVVLDSVNPENNVTSTWTTKTRSDFLDRVQEAYDSTTAAWSAERDGDEDEAVDYWCEVFGDDFRTLSEEDES